MDNKLLIQDLAEAIATKEGLTKKKSEAFVKALFETIEEGLLADKYVKIKGLGTFKIITVGERESVNINTGERFSIEGHEKITFTPDTLLKDLVNRPFAHFQTVMINDDTDIDELEKVNENEDKKNEVPQNDNVLDDTSSKTSDIEESSITYQNSKSEKDDEHEIEEQTIQPQDSEIDPTSKERDEVLEEETLEDPSAVTEKEMNDTSLDSSIHTDESHQNDQKNIYQDEESQKEEELSNLSTASDTTENGSLNSNIKQSTDNEDATMKDENETNSLSSKKENDVDQSNVQQEQIKDLINELDKKNNVWKITSLILLSLLLLVLSYFAGYFRWFCPCERTNIGSIPPSSYCPVPLNEENVAPFVDSLPLANDTTMVPISSPKQDSLTQETPNTEKTPKEKRANKINKQEKKENFSNLNRTIIKESSENNEYRQVPGGKYKIVGTINTHKIQNGETIRTIALDIYGSKGYAIYIITHNNIENPNVVETGTVLKLPKLERKI